MPAGLIGWILLHLVIALAGTWLARRYALARRLVDEPGERRSHEIATPRGGGIAIALAMLVALAALMLRVPAWVPQLVAVSGGLLMVAAIGWIDDHRPLSPWPRLAVHALAAALLALASIVAGGGLLDSLYVFALTLVLVNVWNFMDGIDGLAGSQALLVALLLALAAPGGSPAAWFGWALASACAGFLPFNFPRARIFLGDVGSGVLGYALAALVALQFRPSQVQAWVLLPLSAFLLDATLTLGARMVRGERWWTPHVQHLYQRLARQWQGHAGVMSLYASWTLAAGGVAWWVRSGDATTIILAVCAWYLLGAGIWLWSMRVATRSAKGVVTR
jgi:UDP-N-acetylmuramyl pentapeptide phosphotransferase/UDP-N-acetylglucosamine-1-phosphate transferase